MENVTVIIIVLTLFMVLLLSGNYMSTLLLTVGMVGVYLLGGMGRLNGFIANDPFKSIASYSLSTIPLYVIMAQFVMKSGIIKDFYALVYKVSKGKKGILGILTIILGAFLGAVSGSSTATAASLGQISVPELRSRGYSDGLAGTVAAAAGSLSSIVPPSIMLIIYGTTAQVSIGELFTGSFLTGALTALVFCLTTLVYLNTKAERSVASAVEVEVEDLSPGRVAFVLIAGSALIISVFGGIYSGLFTPTEAGAVGAFLALIVALITRSVNIEFFRTSMLETIKVTGMSMILIVAAALFGRFITLSLLPRYLMGLIEPLMAHPTIVLLLIMAIYFFLFMILDGTATVLMTIPVLLPIVTEMNIDLVWFGVFVCLICTLGSLTPPVGFSVYSVGGMTGIPIGTIFKKAMVYASVATLLLCSLLIKFPIIVTWLPSMMS